MPRPKLIHVESPDGRPLVVSGRPGSLGARFCKRHRVTSLAELQAIRALPRWVDAAATAEAIRALRADRSHDERARARVAAEPGAESRPTFAKRVATTATHQRVAELADTFNARIPAPMRQSLAFRSYQLAEWGAFELTVFDADADLDVASDVTFDRDVAVANVGDVRIYQGARLLPKASWFVLNAESIYGNVARAPVRTPHRIDLLDL